MKLKWREIIKAIPFVALIAIIGCNNGMSAITAPNEVSNSMAQLYPDVTNIDWRKGEMGTWEADFNTNNVATTIIFDSIGAFILKVEQVTYAETPENINTYFNSNSGLGDLKQVERFTNAVGLAFYKAKLADSDVNYYFDINGGFIREAVGNKSDIEMEMVSNKNVSSIVTNNIPITDLPVDIINFIAYSHSGYMIGSASYKTLCGGIDAIEAIVVKEEQNKSEDYSISLIFTQDGKYIRTEQGIDFSDVPDRIKQEIASSFNGFKPNLKAKLLTLTNNDETQYLVNLEKDSGDKEVIFKVDGNIVCEN